MHAQYLWHAGAHPSEQQWPLVPVLRPDELFSSWLIRCSLCHACDPLEIAQLLWPARRIWTRDCDLGVCGFSLAALANLAGFREESLREATLEPVCRLLGNGLPKAGITPWVLSQGGRNVSRAGGLQYCPLCFMGPRPYYKMQWRLAWHTCCPEHGVQLRDRCPHCQAILSPHRLGYQAIDLRRCHQCHGLLCEAEPKLPSAGAEELELFADSVVRGRSFGFGGLRLSPEDWFALIRGLHRLVRALLGHRTGPARAFLELLDVDLDALPDVSLGLPLESLPVSDRVTYLSAVNSILKAGAARFSTAAESTHLCHSSCRAAGSRNLPCLAQLLPQTTPRTHVHGVSDRDSPRGRNSVLRSWLLFQRKASRAGVI
ncbi:TPA: TniQ family protein, partial [Pseudomonas aeruginosa]